MNNDNLIPLNQRTKSEQREIAQMGGIASGEARRIKKTLKELLFEFLEGDATDETSKTILCEFGQKTGSRADAFALRLIKSAMDGDSRAARMILEMTGEISQNKNVTVTGKPIGEVKIYIPDNGRDAE